MPLRASLFLPTTACPSLNILNDPGCSATKLIGKSLFGTNRGYLARSGTRVSDHVVRTTNSDTHVQGSRHKCNCPSFVKDSSFKVGSASKILAGRNIGQQDLGRAQHRAASKHCSISQTTQGKESCLCGRKRFETPWPLRPIVAQQSGTRRLLKMPQGRIFADLPMEN